MRGRRRLLPVLLLAALVAAMPASAQTAPDFVDTFSSDPASPQPFVSPHWDVLVHHRGASQGIPQEAMAAQHGMDCGPHPATHATGTVADSVFSCKNHMMTAINAGDYGAIYLTPDAMADFSSGEASIRFDVSTLRTSNRDWIDLWVTPYGDNLAAPLESWLPDLQGRPRNAVHVRMIDVGSGGTGFLVWVIRNGVETAYGNGWPQMESAITPSAITRSTFELRLSQTHVSFGMPSAGLEWVNETIPALDWTRGVVQLAHHSYNPEKAGQGRINDTSPGLASGITTGDALAHPPGHSVRADGFVDVGILGRVLVPPGAVSDAGSSELSARPDVCGTPGDVRSMVNRVQVGGVDAGAVSAEMVNFDVIGQPDSIGQHVRHAGGNNFAPQEYDPYVAFGGRLALDGPAGVGSAALINLRPEACDPLGMNDGIEVGRQAKLVTHRESSQRSRGATQPAARNSAAASILTESVRQITNPVANTWHWDNVEIDPASPLTFVKAQGTPDWHAGHDTVTLEGPSPAGAHLRLQAVGTNMQASFDGGASWVTLNRQPSEIMSGDQGHMTPYWHPIPAGVSSIKLRGSDWYAGGWRSNYAAVWAQGSAATPTATPVPPTVTPTMIPTATLVPTSTPPPPTATTAPTSTPAPTATVEPAPAVCTYRVFRDDALVAEWGC